MDKEQLERLFSMTQIASGLTMLYAFFEESIILEELPDELREDTELLYKSLEQLGEKFTAYINTALNNLVTD